MALLKPTTKRCDIPHEPGEWIEIRRLSSMDGLDTERMGQGRLVRIAELGRYYLSAIVAWSYPDAVTLDAIIGSVRLDPDTGKPNAAGEREGGLDKVTSLWLMDKIGELARGDKTEAELLAASSPSIDA